MSSPIVEGGGEDGVGVKVSGLDMDLLKHGLHDDEEVGFVNCCVWQASPGIWGEDTQLFTLHLAQDDLFIAHTGGHMPYGDASIIKGLISSFHCYFFLFSICNFLYSEFRRRGFACKVQLVMMWHTILLGLDLSANIVIFSLLTVPPHTQDVAFEGGK